MEIWNYWTTSTFRCNRHHNVHIPPCDHRHRTTLHMQRRPTAGRTWFFRSSRGHGRPPLKAFSLSHLDRVFRPLPQEALQEDQGDQSLSLQSSGQGMWHTSSVYPDSRGVLRLIITVMMSRTPASAKASKRLALFSWSKHQELISRLVGAI